MIEFHKDRGDGETWSGEEGGFKSLSGEIWW